MAARYKGNNRLGQVAPEAAPGHSLWLRMQPADVHLFMTLIEGYTHLAFPVQYNPQQGVILLHTTPDFCKDINEIVRTLPVRINASSPSIV